MAPCGKHSTNIPTFYTFLWSTTPKLHGPTMGINCLVNKGTVRNVTSGAQRACLGMQRLRLPFLFYKYCTLHCSNYIFCCFSFSQHRAIRRLDLEMASTVTSSCRLGRVRAFPATSCMMCDNNSALSPPSPSALGLRYG